MKGGKAHCQKCTEPKAHGGEIILQKLIILIPSLKKEGRKQEFNTGKKQNVPPVLEIRAKTTCSAITVNVVEPAQLHYLKT